MLKRIIFASFLAVAMFSITVAQDGGNSVAQRSSVTITAAAFGDRIRITAPASVVGMHVQVFASSGEKVLDHETKSGNVFDWQLPSGQRLPAGRYLCVVSVKSISGRHTQRLGSVNVNDNALSVEPVDSTQLSAPQAQALGPMEENSWAVLEGNENQTPTVIAHDGTDGQLTRGRGALTFRLGDFFSDNDKEQMRLTEEGNLGIGTTKPETKLDVAGAIRAREGFAFSDGSKLNVNEKGSLQLTNPDGSVVPNAAGSGTQNRVTKWTETGGAGTLGDSAISEINGNVGIGTTTPGGQLHIFGTATQDIFAGMGPNLATGPALNFGYAGSSFGRGVGFFNVRPDAAAIAPNPSLRFITVNQERMIVTNTGNVGIGTSNPTAKLDVTGIINASNYNLAGSRILSTGGSSSGLNTFLGIGAGSSISPLADSNSFFGNGAGQSTSTAGGNSFFGKNAGQANKTGGENSFFGSRAGETNTTGNNNSFFGVGAGDSNTTACCNSFFGRAAGAGNTTGTQNSFFGMQAGLANQTGINNSFFGFEAGTSGTSSGVQNSFFGSMAGRANVGANNSFFGFESGAVNRGSFNSFFGSGSGAGNTDGENNSFFGLNSGRANTTGNQNSFFGRQSGRNTTTGNDNTFVGFEAGVANVTGNNNTIVGRKAGLNATTGSDNTFIGSFAGGSNNTGSNNTTIGAQADVFSGAVLTNATAIGYRALVAQSNSIVLGGVPGANGVTDRIKVGIGTTNPSSTLHMVSDSGEILMGDLGVCVSTAISFNRPINCGSLALGGSETFTVLNGPSRLHFNVAGDTKMFINQDGEVGIGTSSPNDELEVAGRIRVSLLGNAGSNVLCHNVSNQISSCSSSIRYKSNINNFSAGLDLIRRLRPVSFNWKVGNKADMGLVAEEVNEVEPLLTTFNDKGEIEGVKYDRVGVVLVNAVNEQQTQIEGQQIQIGEQQQRNAALQIQLAEQSELIKWQQAQLDALTSVICAQNPAAQPCRAKAN